MENLETNSATICKISVFLAIFKAKMYFKGPHEMENNALLFNLGNFWKLGNVWKLGNFWKLRNFQKCDDPPFPFFELLPTETWEVFEFFDDSTPPCWELFPSFAAF